MAHPDSSLPDPGQSVLTRARQSPEAPAWMRGLYAGLCLYLFLSALNIMSAGLGMFGEQTDFMERLFAYGQNPFIALMAAVLVTALVQSSSFTTALIVTLVAGGDMPLGTAVYAIMGANIGTAVTGVIVSLANIRIRSNFRRSFTAALLHDFFNILTVMLLFPLEWISSLLHEQGRGVITRMANTLSDWIGLEEVANPNSPVRVITRPIVNLFEWLTGLLMPTTVSHGLFLAAVGLVLMFVALVFMVQNLRGALLRRMDGLFRTYFFRNDLRAYLVGLFSTVMVQSSTITSSLMVPLAGAGIVPMFRVLPFMIGANLGTTVTSILAATANPVSAAMTVALFHVLFNLIGTAIWYPLRHIPTRIAMWYGNLAAEATRYAFLFLALIFFVVPVAGIVLVELFVIYG